MSRERSAVRGGTESGATHLNQPRRWHFIPLSGFSPSLVLVLQSANLSEEPDPVLQALKGQDCFPALLDPSSPASPPANLGDLSLAVQVEPLH